LIFQRIQPTSQSGFVVKTSKGSQGTGVFFCDTTRQVLKKIRALQVPVVVQEFIPLDTIEDIRLLMVGTTLCAAMKRVVQAEHAGEFRANISLGSAKPIPYVPTEEMISYAQQIMRHTQLDFAGIDLLVHNDKPLFLECNTRPGLHGIIKTDASIGARAIQLLLSRAMSSSRSS
jgi:glutathione synthase/RimK-type ligase-like ATP-grasp enzyme